MGESVGMVDLHNHILPELDDGAKSLEESIEMCWLSYRDGVRRIVATPHTLNGKYQNDRTTILAKVKELNDALICGSPGLRTPNSELFFIPLRALSTPASISQAILPGEVRRYQFP